MKKIINAPESFVDEVVEGILIAHGDQLQAVSQDNRAIVRTEAGRDGKVGIVTGGGSGHLPLFLGYVGDGLASGVAVGNVFSSPSPAQILAATVASDAGRGVLYLYGNYGGDIYNFDLAADMALQTEAIETKTVIGTDDVMSAPVERRGDRRGVAGLMFAFKTAGAAAARGDDLPAVAAIAQRTIDRTRTMGVGLSPTILPSAGEPTFSLGEGEMEVGIGIHGEPGQHRGPLESADAITNRFLDAILKELQPAAGDRVAVLVNGLGATPLEELYLIYRRTHQILEDRGVTIHRTYIGEYATSLEMGGASLSIMHLDQELAELIDAPSSSPFFSTGTPPTRANTQQQDSRRKSAANPAAIRQVRTVADPGRFREVLFAVTERLPRHADELRQLDAALGDGDLGITVSGGATAIGEAIYPLPADAHPADVLAVAGTAFATANPSTFAALVGSGLLAASGSLATATQFTRAEIAEAGQAFLEQVKQRGGAELGDKTFVDVLAPVVDAILTGGTEAEISTRCVEVAHSAVEQGAQRVSKRGRASWIGERSRGHRDPGSVALLRVIEEIANVVEAP
jgi:dihydroxyacetone kinase